MVGPVTQIQDRGQWESKMEFIFAMAGNIIGMGNVIRFPYLCYKNGGGAFLVPYFLFLSTCGIPLYIMETSMGQYTSQGSITCWQKICPIFGGLGYGGLVLTFYIGIYDVNILSWALFYLLSSLTSQLPWTSCGNTWNTDSCVEFGQNSTSGHLTENATSPAMEFWRGRVLGLSKGIEDLGTIRWELALCLLLSWIISFFCLWKGIQSIGKVVYFTATFPYVMLTVLLVRGLTLPGAIDGVIFYLYPNPSRLADPQVWLEAGTQIMFSCGVCLGTLTALGSYNKYNNNCYRDCLFLCLLSSGTSFVAGFAVFSVLGFMAHEQGEDISSVAESGPGLAFIAYPRAVAMMPLPQLWAVFFFIMIILLGLDCQFANQGSLVTAISDMYPSFFRVGHRQKLLLLVIGAVSIFIGLLMVTEGGLYIFLLFDYYGCAGMVLLILAVFESVCIGWIYGTRRLYDNIEDMIGYRPWPLMRYCLNYVTPCICIGTFIATLVRYTPLKFDNTYEYPWWGYFIGWCLTLSSTLITPLWMCYSICITPGAFCKRLRQLCTPAPDLSPRCTQIETCPPTVDTITEMCALHPDRIPCSNSVAAARSTASPAGIQKGYGVESNTALLSKPSETANGVNSHNSIGRLMDSDLGYV
ncbi:hypothetical protein GJAV_G00183920 [Gymnothorax javanicus]|nr:hypothetical protein GJAV_G00183920 [Gymnothorax javanicus]